MSDNPYAVTSGFYNLTEADLSIHTQYWWYRIFQRVDDIISKRCWLGIEDLYYFVTCNGTPLSDRDRDYRILGDIVDPNAVYVQFAMVNDHVVDLVISKKVSRGLSERISGEYSTFWVVPLKVIGAYLKMEGEV